MATNWYDFYAQCPYYNGTDSKKHITCQGVADSSSLRWIFRQKSDLEIQIKTYCCDKFPYCDVYQMLKQIYEEDNL